MRKTAVWAAFIVACGSIGLAQGGAQAPAAAAAAAKVGRSSWSRRQRIIRSPFPRRSSRST